MSIWILILYAFYLSYQLSILYDLSLIVIVIVMIMIVIMMRVMMMVFHQFTSYSVLGFFFFR